ncbi:MAG: DNA polymerase III subunit beta [Cytophagaceae bacterium BCCC1]|jgi:predicted nucleotidyltransferase|nr:MAG: DNA polymerase III subunit beta [Cytophagaceae bacterium BCCC1]
MNAFGISNRSFEYIKQTFESYPEIKEVLVFGSRAKGNYRNGSDIDLAIKGTGNCLKLALDISGILNERLPIPYQVDVLSYYDLENSDLISHIDRVGKSLF